MTAGTVFAPARASSRARHAWALQRRSLVALLTVVLIQACSSTPPRRADEGANPPGEQSTLYVARRGWHIDVGFSASDLEPPLATARADFPGSRYIFFGFGDKHYLIARHKNFPGLLGALWPSAGLVLATGLVAEPEDAVGSDQVIRLTISRAQGRAAQTFVWNSLIKESAGLRSYTKGRYDGSLFFAAAPSYSAVHTCNTWAAEVMQAADLPVHSIGVVFAAQLWAQARRIDAAARARIGDGATPAAAVAGLHESAATHAHD